MSKRNYRKKGKVAPLASVESGLENETFDLNEKILWTMLNQTIRIPMLIQQKVPQQN